MVYCTCKPLWLCFHKWKKLSDDQSQHSRQAQQHVWTDAQKGTGNGWRQQESTAMEVMPHRAQCPSSTWPTPPTQQRLQPRARSAGLQVRTSSGRRSQPQGGPFYSHGLLSEDGRLLETDGIHLEKQSKDTFASRLAKLVRRHLNKEWWEREIADHDYESSRQT